MHKAVNLDKSRGLKVIHNLYSLIRTVQYVDPEWYILVPRSSNTASFQHENYFQIIGQVFNYLKPKSNSLTSIMILSRIKCIIMMMPSSLFTEDDTTYADFCQFPGMHSWVVMTSRIRVRVVVNY